MAYELLLMNASSTIRLGGYPNNVWKPIDALLRDDADISIVFFAANNITYTAPVYDPMFYATKEVQVPNPDNTTTTWYRSDHRKLHYRRCLQLF